MYPTLDHLKNSSPDFDYNGLSHPSRYEEYVAFHLRERYDSRCEHRPSTVDEEASGAIQRNCGNPECCKPSVEEETHSRCCEHGACLDGCYPKPRQSGGKSCEACRQLSSRRSSCSDEECHGPFSVHSENSLMEERHAHLINHRKCCEGCRASSSRRSSCSDEECHGPVSNHTEGHHHGHHGHHGHHPAPHHVGAYAWVPCSMGEIPHNAFKVGKDLDHHNIYVGRAWHEGDLLPAKVAPSHGGAFVAWGCAEHSKFEYEVLVNLSHKLAWLDTSGTNIPHNALAVGSNVDGETLYAGRVIHEGVMTVGKVHPSHGVLYISWGGKELHYEDYEILIVID